MKEIVLEPYWPNMVRYFAQAFVEGSFESKPLPYGPMVSFIEMVRKLQIDDPDELERILNELRARANLNG